ncbi:MAG TPA: hypothetical protein ENH26_03200 [Candidatus Wolfebacteria bacterium]|nr:hypothetical protein [Candidatus Wolfebacteria bacterium]
MITKKETAEKIRKYLYGDLSMDELVDWAERAMMEDDFEKESFDALRDVVARLGLSDVRAFGLTLKDCEQMLSEMGYKINIEIIETN